jgi:hypothetical protein
MARKDSMTDSALRAAYRKLTAEGGTGCAEGLDAEALAALAAGGHAAAGRDAGLGALAESARNADLLRALRAIAADAAELESSIASVRAAAPAQRRPIRAQRWLALAASIAAAGVIGVALQSPSETPAADPVAMVVTAVTAEADASSAAADATMPAASGRIMMASFENGGESPGTAKIFSADFDS